MKKKLIIGSFMTLASITCTQAQWAGSAGISGDISRSGNVGLGYITSPTDHLHIVTKNGVPGGISGGGIVIDNDSTWGAFLRFKTRRNYPDSGANFVLYGTGKENLPFGAGNFALYDYTTLKHPFFIQGITNNFGIGTTAPTEQLHTTGGVRFEGLTSGGPTNLNLVGIDPITGKLWITTPGGGSPVNPCATTNFVSKTSASGNLTCSQIFDDGTSVGIGATSGFSYLWPGGLIGSTLPPNIGTVKLFVNGVTKALAYFATSDERYKKEIKTIENATSIISKISGKTYYWRTDEFKDKAFNDARQYGLIAQELEKVMPEAVATDENGFKSVSYDMVIPVLIQAVKEQQQQIDENAKEIADLKTQIGGVQKTGDATGINQLNSADDGFALAQNIPNPFNGETLIKYTLPQQIKNASMVVYDLSGKQLTSFPLEIAGNSITITSEKLAAGIYIYSVMADGKIMDSKRMVIAGK